MEAATPFRQALPTPDPTIARLQRDLAADPRLASHAMAAERDRVAEVAVRSLWAASRVKAFVPVLALRDARDALLDVGAAPLAGDHLVPTPTPAGPSRVDDELLLDERDALTLSDDGPVA